MGRVQTTSESTDSEIVPGWKGLVEQLDEKEERIEELEREVRRLEEENARLRNRQRNEETTSERAKELVDELRRTAED